jgi:hypothetical protein
VASIGETGPVNTDKRSRSLFQRLDDAVLGDRGRRRFAGLEYGFGQRAGLKAEDVERELMELRRRVEVLEARLDVKDDGSAL